jgi:hypothetical protein
MLGCDQETGDCAAAIAKQQSAKNNRGIVISAPSAKQNLNRNKEMVFSVRSMLRCYKQDSWNNELVVGQLPTGKNVNREAEDTVGSVTRQQLVKTQQTEKTSCML